MHVVVPNLIENAMYREVLDLDCKAWHISDVILFQNASYIKYAYKKIALDMHHQMVRHEDQIEVDWIFSDFNGLSMAIEPAALLHSNQIRLFWSAVFFI